MVHSLTLSQAFNGMILEKRAAGISPHTISDYLNTLKKLKTFFDDDPLFTSITRTLRPIGYTLRFMRCVPASCRHSSS